MKKQKEIIIIILYFYETGKKMMDSFVTHAVSCKKIWNIYHSVGIEFIDKYGIKSRFYPSGKIVFQLSIVNEKVYPYRYNLCNFNTKKLFEKNKMINYIVKNVNKYLE